MKNPERLVTVSTFFREPEAYLCKARLESERIHAVVIGGQHTFRPGYELQVRESSVVAASDLLRRFAKEQVAPRPKGTKLTLGMGVFLVGLGLFILFAAHNVGAAVVFLAFGLFNTGLGLVGLLRGKAKRR